MSIQKLITHDGIFHADDVFSTALLKELFNDYTVTRTRDLTDSEDAIVYDVGYGKYDHHGTEKKLRKNGMPYAAFGLLWNDYGKEYLEKKFGLSDDEIINRVDTEFVSQIDAVDNGYPISKKLEDIGITSISEIISSFNPRWDDNKKISMESAFIEAVIIASRILENHVRGIISKYKAKDIVDRSITKSIEHIMILEPFVPWIEHLLKSTNPKAKDVLFVVYKDQFSGYRIQTVPKAQSTKEPRKPLPRIWNGKKNDDLDIVAGTKTGIFCHQSGFLAGTETFEDIMILALNASKEAS